MFLIIIKSLAEDICTIEFIKKIDISVETDHLSSESEDKL